MSQKYPRTLHLPWSKGATSDDKMAKDVSTLINIEIVITEKLDGSNCCLESDACYARTHSGPPTHESFDLFKALHSQVKHSIPSNLQLFGENLYALHSISYDKLPAYFMLFNVKENIIAPNCSSVYSDPDFITNSHWLSWDEVEMWADEIGVPCVPVLFKGKVSSEKELKELVISLVAQSSRVGSEREGVVVRVARQFRDDEFFNCVLKYVRANHVQTDDHWRSQEIVKNKLA
jgi:hypothetical protein